MAEIGDALRQPSRMSSGDPAGRAVDRLHQIAEMARAVSSALELEAVLSQVTATVTNLRSDGLCRIRLIDPQAGGYRLAGMDGAIVEEPVPVLKFGEGLTHVVAQTRQPLMVENIEGDTRTVGRDWYQARGLTVYYGVPIQARDELLGVLSVNFPAGALPTTEEREIIELFAAHAAVAIRNARLFAESERRRRTAEALADVGRVISQALDLNVVGQSIARSIRSLLAVNSTILFRLEPESSSLVSMAMAGEIESVLGPSVTFPPSTGVVGLAVAKAAPVVSADVAADSRVVYPSEFRAPLLSSPYRSVLAVPLLAHDHVIGALSLRDTSGRTFTREEIDLAQAFADQAAVALENARLHEETQTRLHQTETLLAVGQAVGSVQDLTEIVRRTTREMVRALGADFGGAWRMSPARDQLLPVAAYRLPKDLIMVVGPQARPLAHPLVQQARTLAGPIYASDSQADPRFDHPWARLVAHKSLLVLPMKLKGDVIGGFGLVWMREPHRFTRDELRLAEAIAGQAAIALENTELYEQAERERRRLEVLYDVSRRLASVHDTDQILSLIVNEAERLLGADAAGLRLLEGEELVLRARTEAGAALMSRVRLRIGESLSGRAAATGEAVTVENLIDDPRYDPVHKRAAMEHGFHSLMSVPLRVRGTIIGALNVYTKRRRRFLPDEVSLLSAFADHASLAIEKDRLFTERQRAEEALRQTEKLATVGQLLAGVAHELNNPLAVIVGHVELLHRAVAQGPLSERVEKIADATERCARIVRNFLALARKQPAERQHVDLNGAIREALELLAYALRVDDVNVTLKLATDAPMLWADPHQLQQVLVNLISNAHQAMRETALPRRLTLTSRLDRREQRAVVEVADTGPGIPPELVSRIFEPFFTTKPVGEGTGLGLSLCQGIIEGHGGTIRVASQPGQGATLIVELPVGAPVAPDDESGVRRGAPLADEKTILVIDDETAIAMMLKEILALDGHRVETASNGAAALEKLRDRSYDVILSDIKMPILDGPALYRTLERSDPTLLSRFVFLTGDTLSPETRNFLAQTGAPCLSKPFDVAEVRRAVELAQRSG